jgi:hypothetical protein
MFDIQIFIGTHFVAISSGLSLVNVSGQDTVPGDRARVLVAVSVRRIRRTRTEKYGEYGEYGESVRRIRRNRTEKTENRTETRMRGIWFGCG